MNSSSSVRLYFTKHFVSGVLSGITINDSLSFMSVDRAADWLKGVRANSVAGKLDYKITDASFQNYAR